MPEPDAQDRWRDIPIDERIPDPDAEGLIPETPVPEDGDDADG